MRWYAREVSRRGGVPYNNQSRFPSQGDPGLQGQGPIPEGSGNDQGPMVTHPVPWGHGGGFLTVCVCFSVCGYRALNERIDFDNINDKKDKVHEHNIH